MNGRVAFSGLYPTAPAGLPCCVCRQPKPDLACERCGIPLHGDCHFSELATDREKIDIQLVDQEDHLTILFLCQGCRS